MTDRVPVFGEVGEQVTAVVVTQAGELLPVDQLDALCRSQLARYKIPRRYERVDVLPRNAGMKILKRDLRARFSSG